MRACRCTRAVLYAEYTPHTQLLTIEETEKATARQLLARGDKSRALSALRRGKYQRSLLSKTDGQLRTLEDLVSNIEFSQIQQSVYHGLERGNEVLKEIHKTLNAESVERLLDQTAEAQAQQRVSCVCTRVEQAYDADTIHAQEIDDLLATRMTAEEEADVQAEMDALLKEQRGAEAEDVTVVPTLPDAPTAEPVKPQVPQREREEEQEEKQQRQALLA